VGIRRADHATPLYLQKLALTSPTRGGRSVGIVSSQSKAMELRDYFNAMKSVLMGGPQHAEINKVTHI
jgi:hypothetical protein